MNYTAEQIRQMTVEYNQKLKEYENNERYKRKAKCTICGDPLRFHNPRDDPNATFYMDDVCAPNPHAVKLSDYRLTNKAS